MAREIIVERRYYTATLLTRLVDIFVGIVVLALGLRLVLRLFGANPATPFVDWVYTMTLPLLEPFRGIFPSQVIDGGFVLEFTTIFAMVAYAILGWLIAELILFIARAMRG